MEILVGECSLYWNYLVQFSFLFGVGTLFPRLFFRTTPLIKRQMKNVQSKLAGILPKSAKAAQTFIKV